MLKQVAKMCLAKMGTVSAIFRNFDVGSKGHVTLADFGAKIQDLGILMSDDAK